MLIVKRAICNILLAIQSTIEHVKRGPVLTVPPLKNLMMKKNNEATTNILLRKKGEKIS